jgi:hypothetical protein
MTVKSITYPPPSMGAEYSLPYSQHSAILQGKNKFYDTSDISFNIIVTPIRNSSKWPFSFRFPH